jgi:hypothetical protein
LPNVRLESIQQPAWFAAAFAICALSGLVIVLRTSGAYPAFSLLVVATLLGITSTGILVNAYARQANDAAPAVAAVKRQLPPGERLASFGRIDHLFAYHYETPIDYHALPKTARQLDPRVRFFAIDGRPNPAVKLPFTWEPIATVVLDRNKQPKPTRTVIVGKRVEATVAKPQAQGESTY